MDAKSPKNLDPKLKEVYERVMGTKVPSDQPIPTPSILHHIASAPTNKQTKTTPNHPASQAFVAGNTKNRKNTLIIALFIFLGIIFFLVYTFFWIKLFGIHLSFLPF